MADSFERPAATTAPGPQLLGFADLGSRGRVGSTGWERSRPRWIRPEPGPPACGYPSAGCLGLTLRLIHHVRTALLELPPLLAQLIILICGGSSILDPLGCSLVSGLLLGRQLVGGFLGLAMAFACSWLTRRPRRCRLISGTRLIRSLAAHRTCQRCTHRTSVTRGHAECHAAALEISPTNITPG